jgi:hypothetical protein
MIRLTWLFICRFRNGCQSLAKSTIEGLNITFRLKSHSPPYTVPEDGISELLSHTFPEPLYLLSAQPFHRFGVNILAWPLFSCELTPERYLKLNLLILKFFGLIVLFEHFSDQLILFDTFLLLGVLVKEVLEELEHLLALQVVHFPFFNLRLFLFDNHL